MIDDTLITDVRGDEYLVQATSTGFTFVTCSYNADSNRVFYVPAMRTEVITARPVTPLHLHEAHISRLISVNLQLRVPGAYREINYQPN